MKLNDTLVHDACVVDMKSRTKKDALRELAEALAAHVSGLSAAALLDLLVEREKLGTTALGDGIALPHARVESLDKLLLSFGRSRAGVDFDSVDGKPTHLFFVLVAPGREGRAHLLTLARLSRLLARSEFRSRLLEVETLGELSGALEDADAEA
jgi:PTS system nitrogen regulatory IIA component